MPDIEFVLENPKGSYKSFEVENESTYPLAGVTYPVDYGYAVGYGGEDGADLDVFRGTGELNGKIVVWRLDVPTETKFAVKVTADEWAAIQEAFRPVLREATLFNTPEDLRAALLPFRKAA